MQPLVNFWCISTYQLSFVFTIMCYGTSKKTLFEHQPITFVGFLFPSVTLSLRLYTSSAPCSTVHCQRYAECVSTDNATGVCVCPHECPYQRSSVCGSDGKTYINDCHLRVSSCRRKANVSVRYAGECNKWRLLSTLIIVLIYQFTSLPENETCKPLPICS